MSLTGLYSFFQTTCARIRATGEQQLGPAHSDSKVTFIDQTLTGLGRQGGREAMAHISGLDWTGLAFFIAMAYKKHNFKNSEILQDRLDYFKEQGRDDAMVRYTEQALALRLAQDKEARDEDAKLDRQKRVARAEQAASMLQGKWHLIPYTLTKSSKHRWATYILKKADVTLRKYEAKVDCGQCGKAEITIGYWHDGRLHCMGCTTELVIKREVKS